MKIENKQTFHVQRANFLRFQRNEEVRTKLIEVNSQMNTFYQDGDGFTEARLRQSIDDFLTLAQGFECFDQAVQLVFQMENERLLNREVKL